MSNISHIENELWSAADNLRAMSSLGLRDFAEPVLAVVFLKFADMRFEKVTARLEKEHAEKSKKSGRKIPIEKSDYDEESAVYLPEKARYEYLLNLPESENLGEQMNEAMKAIEQENDSLKGILFKNFHKLNKDKKRNNDIILGLLKAFNSKKINSLSGDVFGNIYEYFLGKFALADGQGGGEFFTPKSIVQLIVSIIEPHQGTIFDPACGSGGMFVQSLSYITDVEGKSKAEATKNIAVYGQEKNESTVNIARLNLAINGLKSGNIVEGNSFYSDAHHAYGKFDYVMANPPFNVKGLNKDHLQGKKLYKYGIPSVDNANYLWIQMFLNSLNDTGRAGFVMANSASDASHSEEKIRKGMIEDHTVDVIISVGPNMFYNVTLPCTLWFLDKEKKDTERKDSILFINAKNIYRQIDRAHREFTPEQIQFLSLIVQLYRSEDVKDFSVYIKEQQEILEKEIKETKQELEDANDKDEKKFLKEELSAYKDRQEIAKNLLEQYEEHFTKGYADVSGLCNKASLEKIEENSWSLNPGRYVGIPEKEDDDFDFEETMTDLHEEFQQLTDEAYGLEKKIVENVEKILEG